MKNKLKECDEVKDYQMKIYGRNGIRPSRSGRGG